MNSSFLFRLRSTAWLSTLLIFGIAAQSVAQEPVLRQNAPVKPTHLSLQTLSQIAALEQEEDQRSPAQQKLDSHLWHAAKMKAGLPVAANVPTLRTGITEDEAGLVLVDIDADVSAALLTQIEAAGGKVISSFPQFHALRARLPLLQMERLAGLPAVHFIRPADLPILQRRTSGMPLRPLVPFLTPAALLRAQMPALLRQAAAPPPTGSVDSEGDTTHRANLARSAFHVDGTGIKIGVISDSDDFLENSQASGDLPSTVTVLPGQSGRPGSGEGTAMMEIVHDIAPGASIYFATSGGSQASFASNVMALYNAGCKIIVDDISFSAESPFQDGVPAQAVEYVTAHGALYFSAATNNGNKADGTASAWASDFVDSGQTISGAGGGKVAVFIANDGVTGQPSLINNVSDMSGNGQTAVLFWSDPLGHSTNDYNLFVIDGNGSVVDASTNVQNGTQDPYENVTGVPNGDALVIVLHSGAARFLHLDLATQNGTLNWVTGQRTRGHATVNAVGAYGVAATPAYTASPNYGQPTGPYPNPFDNTDLVEFFSSDGPSHQFYHEDGTPITANNFSSTGGIVLQKPDITAADGVSTSLTAAVTSPSPENFAPFFGTSAAAPHAASIAALLLSYNPTLTQAQVRSLLTGTAIDIMGTGWDQDSGYGILDADALLTAAPSPAKVVPTKLTFSPNPVVGGQVTTGTLTLSGAAPAGGAVVTITQNGTSLGTITVTAGQTSGGFTLTPVAVTTTTNETIGAVYNGTTVTTTLTVTPAPPTLTSFTPTSGPVGTSVSLAGTNFTGATAIKFHGTAATTFTVSGATQITATVPTGATTGTISVTTPGGTATSTASFTVTTAAAKTTLAVSAVTGAPGQTVTLTATLTSSGAGVSGKTVTFSIDGAAIGAGVTSSSGVATKSYLIAGTLAVGSHSLSASFAGDSAYAASTGAGRLTVIKANTAIAVAPVSGAAGTTVSLAATLTNTTNNAALSGATLTFSVNGATAGTAVTNSSGTAVFSYSIPSGTAAGSHSLSVSYAGAASYNASTGTGTLTVTSSAPTLTSFTPTSGPVGTSVSLAGTNFTGATAIKFHGTAATTFTVSGATQITATVPTGATTGTISVTTPGGTVTSTASFTVTTSAGVTLTSLVYNPNPGFSSGVSLGTATLSGPAPTGGASVVISYSGTTLTRLSIPAGQTQVTYQQGLPAVTTSQSFSIGATYSGKTVSATLVVNPTTVTLNSFTLSPNPATSGGTLTGMVTLSGAAPAGGVTVTISQNMTVLGSVTVAAGSASQSFTLFAPSVTASTVYPYTAAFNGTSKTVQETVNPAAGLP